VDREAAFRRLAEARVGRLATADATGIPHVVPFVFALDGSTVYWAVDRKPKRSRSLKRLQNIRANPNVELVVDGYSEEWSDLWWIRAAGTARIVEERSEFDRAIGLLQAKYSQYRDGPPPGPVVAIDILRWSAWESRGHDPAHAEANGYDEV
jgi:PPOX class probable F420-dependent enzyme